MSDDRFGSRVAHVSHPRIVPASSSGHAQEKPAGSQGKTEESAILHPDPHPARGSPRFGEPPANPSVRRTIRELYRQNYEFLILT